MTVLRPLPPVILLVAVQTGCEAIFPIDRYMGGSDASSVLPPSIDADEVSLPAGRDVESGGGMDGLARDGLAEDAALDAASVEDASSMLDARDGAPSKVVYRSATSARSTTGTLTVATPKNAVVGDLLWLTLYTDHQNSTVATPAGWTAEGNLANKTADFRAWWFYEFVGASDPASTVFTISGSALNVAGLVAFAGVDRAAPFQSDTAAAVTGSPFNAPSLTTTNPDLVLVVSLINDNGDGATWTASPPLTGLISKGVVFVGDMIESDAGLSGAATATCTQNGTGVVSVVALNPAGTKGAFHPGVIGSAVTTATP